MERSVVAAKDEVRSGWVVWLLLGVGLGVVGCWLMWFAGEQLDRAQRLATSTFDFAERETAQGQLLFIAAGAVFCIVVLLSRGRSTRDERGLLLGAALPPLGLLLAMWDLRGPTLLPTSIARRLHWATESPTQAAAAVAAAVVITTLMWRTFERRQPQKPNEPAP